MGLDREALLAFLLERSAARSPLVSAIYSGLADRVSRGDFNENEERI